MTRAKMRSSKMIKTNLTRVVSISRLGMVRRCFLAVLCLSLLHAGISYISWYFRVLHGRHARFVHNKKGQGAASATNQLLSDTRGLISMDKVLQLPPPVPHRPNSSEPILRYSQRRDYPVLLSSDRICRNVEKQPLFLLVAVKSMCDYASRRDAIRDTWANLTWAKRKLKVVVRRVFLLGACRNSRLAEAVGYESELHEDILQWDFFDSFHNLTVKEVLFLQWFARSCRNARFVFKGDDDVFVNTRNVMNYLHQLPDKTSRTLYVGSTLIYSPRILDPRRKYFVSYNLYPGKYYPPYVSGGGFLMSSEITVKLFQASLRERIIPIDDAFLGILLQRIGVLPGNDRRFKSWGMKGFNGIANACQLSELFTYHDKPYHKWFMRTMWKQLNELDPSRCGIDDMTN